MCTGGHAAKLNEAKAQFETAWRQWLAWASCVRTRSSYAATATLGGPTPGRL